MINILLNNGEEVKASLSYRKLLQLQGKDRKTYDEYQKIFLYGIKAEIDMIHVIYTAYCCENEDPMKRNEFIDLLPEQRSELHRIYAEVVEGPKKSDSKKPLRK